MIAAEPVTFTPRECFLHVVMVKPADRTSGGIWLPDECQVSCNEAEVIAVGPGISAFDGLPSVMHAEVGDRVLFQHHQFQKTDEKGEEGIVREDDLLAIIPAGTNAVSPHNDWVAITIEDSQKESAGGILLSDRARKRPRSGKILDYGPGKFRRTGSYVGTRKTIQAIMGLSDPDCPSGKTVHWGVQAEVLEAGVGNDWFLLVRASDLLLMEDGDEGV